MSSVTISRTTLPKRALPHAFLDGLEQVLGFQFLDGHFGVARDVEGVRFNDVHAGKQRRRLAAITCSSHTKSIALRRRSLAAFAWRARQWHELRQRVGHFDAREVLHAVFVADQHGEVQAEIRDVRKRPAGVEGQRGEHREDRVGEIFAGVGSCACGELG